MKAVLAVGVRGLLPLVLLLQLLCANALAQAPDSSLLADALPDDWRQFRQREPVFGSDLFWIEAGKVGKPTVLLVHGLGAGGLRSLTPVITGLASDYHVVALDLPGFGLSGVTLRPLFAYQLCSGAELVVDRT